MIQLFSVSDSERLAEVQVMQSVADWPRAMLALRKPKRSDPTVHLFRQWPGAKEIEGLTHEPSPGS
jgi:hypothetical protein